MAKLAKAFEIDDVTYEITQLGGVEGLDLYDRLTRELGPAVFEAIRTALSGGGGANAEARVGFTVMEALATLPSEFKKSLWVTFAGLSKVKAGDLMLPLGDGLKLTKDDVFDQHFAGRFGHMTRWLMASLKWSFVDFLPKSDASAEKPAATK